jgi:hypothetical protein
MDTYPPSWELARRCHCCDGNGALIFSTCPRCALIVLICDEIGNVFAIDNRNLGALIGSVHSFEAKDYRCARCGDELYENFRSATSDEVRALGFVPGEYR